MKLGMNIPFGPGMRQKHLGIEKTRQKISAKKLLTYNLMFWLNNDLILGKGGGGGPTTMNRD